MTASDTRRRHEQWERAAETLDRERRERLRSMTDEEAREAAETLLGLIGELPPKSGRSGLVTQQQLFRRARR